MSWRIGVAAVAALSLAILPLSINSANADDTTADSPSPAPSAAESASPSPNTLPAPTESTPPSTTPASTEPPTTEPTNSASKTIIITFDKAQSDPARAAEAAVAKVADQVADAQVTKVSPITDSMVAVTLDSPLSTTESVKVEDQVSDATGVKAAETAGWFRPTATNDAYYSDLWNLASASSSVASRTYGTHAEDAWATSTGANAIVGVIDTGITAHPDLTGSSSRIIGGNVIDGYDFISDACVAGDGGACMNGHGGDKDRDSNPTDTGDFTRSEDSSWHGTHVAGIIAAIANNQIGVAGVAPDAKIEPLRALGRGGGLETDVIAAIYWGAGISVNGLPANPQPADVLNLSLGMSGDCSTAMQTAINAATARDVIVVAAAGNGDTYYGNGLPVSTSSPANCENVISVGATTKLGTLAGYSNYGGASELTISAPGGGDGRAAGEGSIRSTINSGSTTLRSPGYDYMSGTSMAAPHVAATVALLKSLDPSLTLAEVKNLLTTTAETTPSCGECGAGRLNTAAAVAALAADLGVSPASASLQSGAPLVSGTLGVGQTLAAAVTADASASLSYQWYRNGAKINGATGKTHLLTASDKGKYLLLKVTATSGEQTTIRFSAETAKIGVFAKSSSPKASGTFRKGKTVTASNGTWSPSPSSYSYRWLRSGKSISGAIHYKYKLTSKDRGKKISVRITVRKSGFTTTSATSSSHTVKH